MPLDVKKVSPCDAQRTFIVGILWRTSKPPIPLWCPGSVLYQKCQTFLPADMAFADEGAFRVFMATLADESIIQEKHGRTRIEPDIARLQFTLSTWLHAIMVSISAEK